MIRTENGNTKLMGTKANLMADLTVILDGLIKKCDFTEKDIRTESLRVLIWLKIVC